MSEIELEVLEALQRAVTLPERRDVAELRATAEIELASPTEHFRSCIRRSDYARNGHAPSCCRRPERPVARAALAGREPALRARCPGARAACSASPARSASAP